MPIYEYKREDGTTFETKQGINDDPLTHCPDTGQPVKRLISGGVETLFVGSNWPDKQAKKQRQIENDPYQTTLPNYKKKIKENSEKARELKEQSRPNIKEV